MQRSGAYIKQPTGYRAFIPAPLPPKPALRVEGELQNLLSRADMALARLDGLAEILPNVDLFIAMYVKKRPSSVLRSRVPRLLWMIFSPMRAVTNWKISMT